VAQIHIVATHDVRLINLSITVIVQAVAALLGGDQSVTVGQPLFGADTLAGATSAAILNLARRP